MTTQPLSEDLLSAYVDGELAANERAAVEARLAESPGWRAILAEVREARDAVRALPTRDAPPAFWDQLLVRGRVVDLTDARKRRQRAARWGALAAAAAAAAAVVVGVAVVPGEDRVHPDVATLVNAHAVRSSIGNDLVSNVAGASVRNGFGR
jgi:anti-sigma factor RsiW